uniref:Uncharacterized protein n=1 Tax=Aegilops tauschii subsp. strangulata TaxID=200361 RepID=A0A452Y4C9_AEGTS
MSGDAAEAQRARAANGGGGGGGSSNRIQVSNTKKPLFFYVNLAKRYMQQHGEVELSAPGMGHSDGRDRGRDSEKQWLRIRDKDYDIHCGNQG